jgi:hypothetical protein
MTFYLNLNSSYLPCQWHMSCYFIFFSLPHFLLPAYIHCRLYTPNAPSPMALPRPPPPLGALRSTIDSACPLPHLLVCHRACRRCWLLILRLHQPPTLASRPPPLPRAPPPPATREKQPRRQLLSCRCNSFPISTLHTHTPPLQKVLNPFLVNTIKRNNTILLKNPYVSLYF